MYYYNFLHEIYCCNIFFFFKYSTTFLVPLIAIYSFHNSIDTSMGNGKIFTASENAIYIHSTQDDQLNVITQQLMVCLETSSLTFIIVQTLTNYLNNHKDIYFVAFLFFLTIYDIIEKATIPPNKKYINQLTEFEDIIYIATDYGISLYNLNLLEFGDSLFIGDGGTQQEVNQVTINNNYLYATLPEFGGVRRVSLDLDVINYQNWEVVYPGDFNFILNLNDNFIFTDENSVFYSQNDSYQEVVSLSQPINDIVINDKTVSREHLIVFIDDDKNKINKQIDSNIYNVSFNSSVVYNNNVYIATSGKGLLKININNIQQYYSIFISCFTIIFFQLVLFMENYGLRLETIHIHSIRIHSAEKESVV